MLSTIAIAGLLWARPGYASESLVLDGRDAFTLLDSHPLNHQLFLQLKEPRQAFRLGPKDGYYTALADVEIGTQQAFDNAYAGRFHGWSVADTYAAVRPFNGLELNLNLLLVNPSASDGYRASSTVHPGVGLHVSRELFELAHHPLRLDVLGIDLGWTTTGAGLLLESTPLEGVVGIVRWKDWELRYLIGGRALWDDDDYDNVTLRVFDGLAELNLLTWQAVKDVDGTPKAAQVNYATLTSRWPIFPFLHLSQEYGYRAAKKPKVGTLIRVDTLLKDEPRWAFHLGYQFRYYQAGFGPREGLSTPTWPYNSLAQEDAYQTNPFEYLGISSAYDQWSHSVMAEGRARLFQSFEPYLNLEVIQRYARSKTVPRFVAYTPDGFRAPGERLRGYFESGLRYYPFKKLPHRGVFAVTNHAVDSGVLVTTPVAERTFYHSGLLYNLTLEAHL